MKHFLFALCLLSASTFGQTRIKAAEIIKQINDGKAVRYTNVEIEGDLDLTDLQNRNEERSSTRWFRDENSVYSSSVDVSLNFDNCTFLGDVLAYYYIERQDTYIAHFEKDVVFKNCVFNGASEFKYSEFNGIANFEGCAFNDPANFKYAEFSTGPVFADAKFNSEADFKYTEFPRETSFQRATFRGLANFKYSRFRTPLNLDGVAFKGSEDFKYTKIDGGSFTSYLLSR